MATAITPTDVLVAVSDPNATAVLTFADALYWAADRAAKASDAQRGQPRRLSAQPHPSVGTDHRDLPAGQLADQDGPVDDLVIGTGGPGVPVLVQQHLDAHPGAAGHSHRGTFGMAASSSCIR